MGEGNRTVVALGGRDRQATRGFLELLAHCLADGDTILLAGGHPQAPSNARTWRTVRAGRLVRPATVPGWRPTVVVVDERAVPVGPWIAPLECALDDPAIGAAAPRANVAAGDELLVGVPYRPDEAALHRELVRQRAKDRAVTEATCLDGPALALRHRDFEAVGGLGILGDPAPIGEIARRIARRGQRLVVAEGSYLHTAGGPDPRSPAGDRAMPDAVGMRSGTPLVSACLIVKDERENLPRCLRSIEGFADEVVVYDTGSVDGTPEVARALGATVVVGTWDDDFSRARNAALDHCTGQWILWVDADEELVCDDVPVARRRLAEMPAAIEALVVFVDNVRGTAASTSLSHPACRLFRRACGHWVGHLHEQVKARAGTPELHTGQSHDVRITHWGYLHGTIDRRAKGRRNVRSAFSDVVGDSSLSWEMRLVSLARSYGLVGQPEEAVDLCRAVLAGDPSPWVRRLALRALVDDLLMLGDPEQALFEAAALRDASKTPNGAAIREGRALLALGRPAEALAAFERLVPGIDDDGFELGPDDVAADRARALCALDRYGDAADVLLDCLRRTGGMDVPVATLVEALERAGGRSVAEIAACVPTDRAVAFLAQLVHLRAEDADRALEAWFDTAPSLPVLATAAAVAPRLPVHRQLVWSTRLRAAGRAHACPLVAACGDSSQPVAGRVLGAALAGHVFGDGRGRQAVAALAASLDAGARSQVRDEIAAIASSVLPILDGIPPSRMQGHVPAGPGVTREIRDAAVLLVDRQPGSIGTTARAMSWRAGGWRVVVSWPHAGVPSGELLEAAGISVVPWGPGVGVGPGVAGVAAAVAAAYADEPFDIVVLAPSVAPGREELEAIEALVPGAAVVVDDASSDISLLELFGAPAPVPWDLRTGIVIVGDFAAAGDEAIGRFEEVVAPVLRQHLGSIPVCVGGFDPCGRVCASIPGAVALGPLDDPLPWLGAARAVLVATDEGARHWMAAAALAGTPVRCVPPVGGATTPRWRDAVDSVCTSLAALADPGALPPMELVRPAGGTLSAGTPGREPAPEDPSATLLGPSSSPSRRATVPGSPNPPMELRRGLPPDLSPRRSTRCVVELHWGYASVPLEWIGPLRDVADEVWVPGTWGASVLEAAGVRAGSVRIVPPAVDTLVYDPEREPRALVTEKTMRFLFVGDCDEASGIDALLEAYYVAFGAGDDVCLVVHPTGDPRARTFEPDIRRAAAGGCGRPEVELVEGPLAADELAGLYRACDVLVHPHRAAGSPEVPLSAMASGRPVVTLDAGVGADVCSEKTGWLVPCRSVLTAAPSWLVATRTVRQLEPRRAALAGALREAAASPDLRLRKGLAARQHVVSSYSRDVAAAATVAFEDAGDHLGWPEAPASPVGAATHRGAGVLAVS